MWGSARFRATRGGHFLASGKDDGCGYCPRVRQADNQDSKIQQRDRLRGLRTVPVLDGDRLVGVLSRSDLL
jgi:hypothetical protein